MKLYLVGGENNGWALDTDLRLLKEALGTQFTLVDSPLEADFIHSVSMPSDYKKYDCSRLVGVFPCNPKVAAGEDEELLAACQNHGLIAQSTEAERLLREMGCEDVAQIPYVADLQTFKQISQKADLRKQLGLPKDAFIVGSFVRDTEGSDLISPKLVKGPDVFCDIMNMVTSEIGKEHVLVLLAGPRRFWIRKCLTALGIPYKFIGKEVPEGTDDNDVNILSAAEINRLMNACDMMLVTSRNEGGPRAILEAAAAKVPIISTQVGIAPDILAPECIYKKPQEAAALVVSQYKEHSLDKYVAHARRQVLNLCAPKVVGHMYAEYYENRWKKVQKDLQENGDKSIYSMKTVKKQLQKNKKAQRADKIHHLLGKFRK